MRRTWIALVGLLLLGLAGYAQNITGSMTGRVVDQQDAAVAGATVTVTDVAKNVKTAQKTSSEG
ncbi:MAG TPA: hypothetical protein VK493_08875, partial [Bryobacteraceae bacterium]|nr:hypothetical protein [Bryobacteraceae bacterium]